MILNIFKKFLFMVPTIFIIVGLSFSLIRLVPGDPVINLLGERGGDPETVQKLKERLGLDQPLHVQFFKFVGGVAQGDFGDSIISRKPVSEEFWSRFPATLELSIFALFWSTLLGIFLGIAASRKQGTVVDYSIVGASVIGYSLPIFWWGLIVIIVFSVWLGWFPVSGRIDVIFDVPFKTGFYLVDVWFSDQPWQAFVSALKHLVLPGFVLGTIPLAVLTRMTRSSMLEVIKEDYVRTARAKGLSAFRVIYVHAFRNALVPVVTTVGIMFASLITGAVLTETIFAWPGIGRWIVKSVEARDYPVVQGGIIYLAVLVIFVNFLIDVLYLWVYPKMRGKS
jgi:dipeptide transport system permease protein